MIKQMTEAVAQKLGKSMTTYFPDLLNLINRVNSF